MESGWLLIGGLTGVGGLAGFAWHEMRHDRASAKPAIPSPEVDPSVAAFRADLIHVLKNPPLGGVDVHDLASVRGITLGCMAEVCQDLYRVFARKSADDGIITPAERVKLDTLAATLDIPPYLARAIEDEANLEVHREDLEVAHEDGVITTEEADHLERLRQRLSIPDEVAAALEASDVEDDPANRPPSYRVRYAAIGSGVGLLVALLLLLANRPASPVTPELAQSSAPAINNDALVAGWQPGNPAEPITPGSGGGSGGSHLTGASLASAGSPPATSSGPSFSMPNFSMPSWSSASHTGGSVSVRGYTRKDGTYVQPHTRSAPRSSARSSSHSSSSGRSGGGRRR